MRGLASILCSRLCKRRATQLHVRVIDRTLVGIPSVEGQDEVEIEGDACFSVHKRKNCLYFLAATVPDGICVHFWEGGYLEGSRHDCAAQCYREFEDFWGARRSTNAWRYLYGDLGVRLAGVRDERLQEPKRRWLYKLPPRIQQGDELQASCCQVDIWGSESQLGLYQLPRQAQDRIVCAAMFFMDCKNCIRSPIKTSQYFHLQSPTLEPISTLIDAQDALNHSGG
jgi:hypothetical protein